MLKIYEKVYRASSPNAVFCSYKCTLSEETLFIIGETDNRNQIFGYLDRISQKWVEAERKVTYSKTFLYFLQKKILVYIVQLQSYTHFSTIPQVPIIRVSGSTRSAAD